MEKILDIIDSIAQEKGLEPQIVQDLVKENLIKLAKEFYDEELNYTIEVDVKNRDLRLSHSIIVLDNDDEKTKIDSKNYKTIEEVINIAPSAVIGDELRVDLTDEVLKKMGRNAINRLFGNVEFHIQRAMENQLYSKFKAMVGSIVSGRVVNTDSSGNTFVEIQDIRAVLPLKNRIKGESFKPHDTINAVLKSVRFDKKGFQVELSRTTPKMLEKLMEQEVPEIRNGEVLIQKCSRIPGDRAKIALTSLSPRIDAIGSAVGTRGVRINAVSKELNGENIDCIEYSEIPEIFIAKAISPAQIISVRVTKNTDEEKHAIISLMSDNKSKAIGKNGVNIRLASMLTGFELELNEINKQNTETKQTESNLDSSENKNAESKKGLDALESLFKS